MRRLAAALVLLAAAGCLALGHARQASRFRSLDRVCPAVATPPGTRAVLVAEGFTYPSGFDFDADGNPWVLESHTVPIPLMKPRLLSIASDGTLHEAKLEGPDAPTGTEAVGVTFHDGFLYVSHEEEDGTWGVTRVRPGGGRAEAVVRGIPTRGDHWINYLAFGPDGALWFGAGSATNSGVVSAHDPVNLKWFGKRRDAHDVPCRDVVLSGELFSEEAEGRVATTGVFQPYGSSDARRLAGALPCTSALYRLPKGARAPELWAWGFRNPVGVAVAPSGAVYVAMQGADVRGTRPVRDDPDAVYRVPRGAWLGWPDFAADLLPMTDPRHQPDPKFLPTGKRALAGVLDLAASGLAPPDRRMLVATTSAHAAVCGTILAAGLKGALARFDGQLVMSEMGDFRPITDPGHPDAHDGFAVVAVDPRTGGIEVVARNRGVAGGPPLPASALKLADALERPVDVRVGPDGCLYVLDFGVFLPKTPTVLPKSGKLFRIEPVP